MNKGLHLRGRAFSVLASAAATVVAVAAQAGGGPHAHASEFSKAVLVAEVSSTAGDGCPIESADGLSLLIASNRTGTTGTLSRDAIMQMPGRKMMHYHRACYQTA